MDCHYEQFQTKDYRAIEKILSILSKIFLFIAIILLILFNFIGVIIFGLLYFGVIILSKKIIVEYEYILTGDEFSIYKIMNKSKRQELGSFTLKQISTVKTLDKISNNTKVIKAYLDESENKAMVYVVKTSKGVTGFHLKLDKKLMELIKKSNPLIFY